MNTPGRKDSIYNPNFRIPFLSILLLLSILLDFLQSRFLPLYLNLDWALIFVFYIGWSTNPIKGGIAGTVFGIVQDFLLGVMLGLNGGIKTIIGGGSSYLSTILNPDLAGIMRFVLIALISLLNNLLLHKSRHILSETNGEIPILPLLISSLLTGIAGDLLFRLLGRLQSDPKQYIR